jgi:hypothetical protein
VHSLCDPSNYLRVVYCVCELVYLTSGVRALVTRVADVWTILDLSPQTGRMPPRTRARITKEREGTDYGG